MIIKLETANKAEYNGIVAVDNVSSFMHNSDAIQMATTTYRILYTSFKRFSRKSK